MSSLMEELQVEHRNDEEGTLAEILGELGIEDTENCVIAVDGQITHDFSQLVSRESRILVVPVVVGG